MLTVVTRAMFVDVGAHSSRYADFSAEDDTRHTDPPSCRRHTGAHMRGQSDDGQGTFEYVSMIVFAALIVGVLVGSGIADDIVRYVADQVRGFLSD